MKRENTRLGRCRACRFWKSAADVLAERIPDGATANEVERLRQAVYEELSVNQLPVTEAGRRGWCLAAEVGGTPENTLLAYNIGQGATVRMISNYDFGCLNHQPRPRRAMNAPPPDFNKNPRLGRCDACNFWSGAENEGLAIYNLGHYQDPTLTREKAKLQALDLLSPAPLDRATANDRGWCRMASGQPKGSHLQPKILSIDPLEQKTGTLITSRYFACSHYQEIKDPLLRAKPDHLIGRNPLKQFSLGKSVSTTDYMLAHMDPSILLDHGNPLSPLHQNHPLNPVNVRSASYNPVAVVSARSVTPSVEQSIKNPRQVKKLGKEPVTESEFKSVRTPVRPTLRGPAKAAPSPNLIEAAADSTKKSQAEIKLADDFMSKTFRGLIGPAQEEPPEAPPLLPQSKWQELKSAFPGRRKTKPTDQGPKRPPRGGGFTERRRG